MHLAASAAGYISFLPEGDQAQLLRSHRGRGSLGPSQTCRGSGDTIPLPEMGAAAAVLAETPEARTLQAWAQSWARLVPVEGEHRAGQVVAGGEGTEEGGIGVSLKLHPHPAEPLTSASLAARSQGTLNISYQDEQPDTANQAQGSKGLRCCPSVLGPWMEAGPEPYPGVGRGGRTALYCAPILCLTPC